MRGSDTIQYVLFYLYLFTNYLLSFIKAQTLSLKFNLLIPVFFSKMAKNFSSFFLKFPLDINSIAAEKPFSFSTF